MKKLLFTLLFTTLLSACGNTNNSQTNSESNSDALSESEVLSESEALSESKTLSESESTPESITPAEGDVTFYAINDFHGAVKENETAREMGIQRVGSFLKEKGKDGNTLLINSGDYWQGSLESNYSYGEMLTKISNYVEFDAFTIGNHEFDWSDTYIKRNRALKDPTTNYSTPFLAANIYNYDISTKTTLAFADLGEKYSIRTLENGIKVGIIGMIGNDQISSIVSNNVDHLTFIKPTTIIKELSDELRAKGCHIVALSLHEGGSGLSDTITDCVDVVFAAHTHQTENKLQSNVPIIQGSCNGKYISKVKLHLDLDGTVTVVERDNLNGEDIPEADDTGITKIINQYKTEYETLGNSVIANLGGSGNQYNTIPHMVTTAFADYAYENNIEFDYAITNNARSGLNSGKVTYSQLYKSLPFDNIVYIAECSGNDLYYQLDYNSFYRNNPYPLDINKTYRILVIDYLATHRNDNRNYDKFRTIKLLDAIKKDGSSIYNYRDITKDWMLDVYNSEIVTIQTADFTNSNIRHNKDSIYKNVDLPTNKYVF